MIGFCSACRRNGDPQTDTVKISFAPPADAADKENAVPELVRSTTKEMEEAEAEERRRAEEEEQRREEERHRLEAMERARREHEEEERRRAEELERTRRKEEERLRRQREEEELSRQRREEAERKAEEERKKEEVGQFLGKNGFAGVNEKKKKGSLPFAGKFTYPLHVAVKAADPKTVKLLLWAGADKSLKDSAKLTPLELARKLDKGGCQTVVIDALSA